MYPTGYEGSLLPAALASTPIDRLRHWSEWRARYPAPDRLGGTDYKLLPYVFTRLQEDVENDPYSSVFRGVAKRVWVHNQLLLAQACALQKELAEGGVPSLLFKGAALLLGPYPRPGDRASADIDVLVSGRHRSKAIALLRRKRPTAVRSGHAISFEGTGFIPADLHWVPSQWSLADPSRLRGDMARIDKAIEARETVTTSGGSAYVPTVNDLALFHLTNLFAHSARVGSNDGLWLLDLARLAATPAFSGEKLVRDIAETDAAAVFQHHFRPFHGVMPEPLRPLADAVLALPLDNAAREIAAALATIAQRAAQDRLEDPFRAQWYALRGHDDLCAPIAMRARYIAFCGRDTVATLALSAHPHRDVGGILRYSAAKTWQALKAQPEN